MGAVIVSSASLSTVGRMSTLGRRSISEVLWTISPVRPVHVERRREGVRGEGERRRSTGGRSERRKEGERVGRKEGRKEGGREEGRKEGRGRWREGRGGKERKSGLHIAGSFPGHYPALDGSLGTRQQLNQ